MRTDEFPPGALLFPFRRRLQAVPLENVGHGLMADFVSQIAQRGLCSTHQHHYLQPARSSLSIHRRSRYKMAVLHFPTSCL